jgi:serine/threonine-protein kinase TTK/MPS1
MRLEQIGRGGSSKVYKVLGPDFQVYALKRVRPTQMNSKTQAIFQNEIDLMKKLRGRPNIIELIDSEINRERKCIWQKYQSCT